MAVNLHSVYSDSGYLQGRDDHTVQPLQNSSWTGSSGLIEPYREIEACDRKRSILSWYRQEA